MGRTWMKRACQELGTLLAGCKARLLIRQVTLTSLRPTFCPACSNKFTKCRKEQKDFEEACPVS